MKTLHTTENITWVHLTDPTPLEIQEISDEHQIHLRTAEELLSANITSKVDLFDNYLYIALRFPTIEKTTVREFEIDCVLTPNALISVSYEEIPAISNLEHSVEANAVLKNQPLGDHAGYLFYFLIARLYETVGQSLIVSERQLDRLEAEVFAGNHREMVRELSEISRALVDTNQSLANHRAVLPALEAAGEELFGESFQYRLHRIHGEYQRVVDKIAQLKETLNELRHTNDSLLTTRQNEVMKTFTIMAFLTFPLSLVSSIFGMNTQNMPLVGHPQGFWIIVSSMIGLVILALFYFRYKKWI
jgi:magnesium transporter